MRRPAPFLVAMWGWSIVAAILLTLTVERLMPHRPASAGPQRLPASTWRAYGLVGFREGPSDAPVTIVEFADYECPFCRALEPRIAQLVTRYPGKLAVVRREYPLEGIHPFAFTAATAAVCGAAAGRFTELHAMLYAMQNALGQADWGAVARRAGIPDTASFVRCMGTEATAVRVRADIAAAERLGALGTPTILVNQWVFQGAPPIEELDRVIRGELAPAK